MHLIVVVATKRGTSVYGDIDVTLLSHLSWHLAWLHIIVMQLKIQRSAASVEVVTPV